MCAPWRWMQTSACVRSQPRVPSQAFHTVSSAPGRPAGGAGASTSTAQKGFWTSYPRLLDFLSTATTIHISGLNHAACILAHSSFVLPLLGWHVEFAPDLLATR